MIYVGNNHVGFDREALGFPSVLGCQAVVYQTRAGLFGFHDMKGGGGVDVDPAKAKAYAQWVQATSINFQSQALCLWGVINQTHQYGSDQQGMAAWKTMLVGVAKAIKFKGPIRGVRLTRHLDPTDSVYIRYDVVGTGCRIRFRRWRKMEFDQGAGAIPLNPRVQQALGKDSPYGKKAHFAVKNPFDEIFLVKRKGRESNADFPDEGSLHTVRASEIQDIR